MKTIIQTMALLAAYTAMLFFFVHDCDAKDYSHYRQECSLIRDDVENWLTAEGVTPDYFYLLVANGSKRNAESRM